MECKGVCPTYYLFIWVCLGGVGVYSIDVGDVC